MNKVKPITLAGVIFSSLMIGTTITTPVVTFAATLNSQYMEYVDNTIVYSVEGTNHVVTTQRVHGVRGYKWALEIPSGYSLASSQPNYITLDANNSRLFVKLTEADKSHIETKINYIDSDTNQVFQTEILRGHEGQSITLNVPDLYICANPNDSQYTLIKGPTSRDVYVKRAPLAKNEVTNTIHYRIANSTGSYLVTKLVTGKIGERVSIEVPDGYKLKFHESSVYLLQYDGAIQIIDIVKDDNAVSTELTFVEEGTNEVVGHYKLTGSFGQTLNVDYPTGYSPVNDSDSVFTLIKGQANRTILVKASNYGINLSSFKSTVMVKSKQTAHLYGKTGKLKVFRSLAGNTDWLTDKKATINGQTYYRVSSDEFVKTSDVLEYTSSIGTINASSGDVKPLYNSEGKQSTRSVAPNTAWYTDKYAIINGQKMFRISTNEWIKASDIN
ncbi:SLAP domain-containing protein [Companilactobacillus mishanensis]|uniref:SLAP domain-containing protein n=1 Tax=Companilactobacillus mishanensis TaxID=2486008 RepID=UPI001296B2A1|nr:SLAP domain-containing protein [Companilactobacillus mishanensis]MQS90351.1 hypothetical protein [Companilactobacillus mishanensis]